MTSREIRETLIRQTQAIRKALYIIECNLNYYEKVVEEEAHGALEASQEKAQPEEEAPDYPQGSA